MKISTLFEMATPSSMPDPNTAAPKFGRSDEMLESGVGTSTAGGVPSISKPMGKMRTRGQGSMFKGISTSNKYANSAKAGISEDSVNEDELSEEQLQAKKRREENFKKAKDRELGNKPKSREIMAKETFNGEYDDEAGMADNNLETMRRAVDGIDDVIGAGDNLPEWCQEKIAVAKSMLVTVWDYMRSEEEIGEGYNNYDNNRTGFSKPKRDLSGEGEPEGMFTVMIDGRPWKEFTSNMAFARAKSVASKNPNKKVQVRWPTGQLNTVTEGVSGAMERAVDAKGRTQAQWAQLVRSKFPNAKITQAKMIDGPMQATLPDGRKLGWSKVEQIDEIIDPSTAAAKALRYIGRKFATAFPWLAVGGVGTGLAASGLLAPLVASMGGITTALSTIGSEMAFTAGIAGTYAAPSIIQVVKDLFAADETSIQAGIKRWVEKHVGDDNDVQEFMLVHSKAAYEGKSGFRWRAKEWHVKMSKEQAEAYLEKNDKFWLDSEKQKAIDAEKNKEVTSMNESSQRVDSLVTDALRIMKGSEVSDAVSALKTVLGDREYNSRRSHYNFYVKQIIDMYSQQGVAEGSENILPRGTAVTVLHKGKQVPGKIVRYDAGKGGYSNAYVVDIGEYESIFVPTNKIQQGVAEAQLDEKCWDTHKQVGMKNKGGEQVPNCVPKESVEEQHNHSESCPHCGGEMVSEELMNEKKDACYYKVKSRYKVWPSAYASGALVKCRKKGADSWGNGGQKSESMTEEELEESLHDWFNKEKWVRMDTKGKIKGPCAREPGEGKPKCLPQSKAHSLGKEGRASAAQRKRREDPNPERSGKAINVNTKKKS
jgi:hypothetical protein